MAITRITSREFNQATSKAKQAARRGPVFITDRGRPSFVLLTTEHYERLVGRRPNIIELLAMPGDYIEFEPERARDLAQAPDLS